METVRIQKSRRRFDRCFSQDIASLLDNIPEYRFVSRPVHRIVLVSFDNMIGELIVDSNYTSHDNPVCRNSQAMSKRVRERAEGKWKILKMEFFMSRFKSYSIMQNHFSIIEME